MVQYRTKKMKKRRQTAAAAKTGKSRRIFFFSLNYKKIEPFKTNILFCNKVDLLFAMDTFLDFNHSPRARSTLPSFQIQTLQDLRPIFWYVYPPTHMSGWQSSLYHQISPLLSWTFSKLKFNINTYKIKIMLENFT